MWLQSVEEGAQRKAARRMTDPKGWWLEATACGCRWSEGSHRRQHEGYELTPWEATCDYNRQDVGGPDRKGLKARQLERGES